MHNPQYREVLAAAGYEYDSTIIEPFNTASSPSWAERLWPYTMDAGIPQAGRYLQSGPWAASLGRIPLLFLLDRESCTILSVKRLRHPRLHA